MGRDDDQDAALPARMKDAWRSSHFSYSSWYVRIFHEGYIFHEGGTTYRESNLLLGPLNSSKIITKCTKRVQSVVLARFLAS